MKGRFKMMRIRQAIYVTALAMLFLPFSFAAAQLNSVPVTPLDKKTITSTIEAFTGNAKALYYSFTHPGIEDKALVSSRILDGFQAGPMRLTLKDGTTIYWGFRYKEATTRSVAIYGPDGRPRLLAAVDSVPGCSGWHCEPFTSIEAYEAYASRTFLHPGITLYVRDKRDLETYLPYFTRWLHAKLLGFNVDCKDPKMADACGFVTQTEWLEIIPTRAYLLPSMRPLELPKVKAADIPLEAFTQ
ncbi:hypothetical protein [Thiobacter aerophilum]|uniref:DUF2092 domain-containing protein n=1 Tax=Thiobacter aerophilum TaxID=3121275 RepID=A0ABV0EIW4_9BURK